MILFKRMPWVQGKNHWIAGIDILDEFNWFPCLIEEGWETPSNNTPHLSSRHWVYGWLWFGFWIFKGEYYVP